MGELWFAFALLLFAMAALWQAYGISGFSGLTSAGVFPMLAAVTMVVAALSILAATLRRPVEENASVRRFVAQVLPARLIAFLALVVGFLVIMPWAGFMPSAAVFLFTATALLWRRGVIAPTLVTATAMVLIWLTFRLAFQIILPRGVLFPSLF